MNLSRALPRLAPGAVPAKSSLQRSFAVMPPASDVSPRARSCVEHGYVLLRFFFLATDNNNNNKSFIVQAGKRRKEKKKRKKNALLISGTKRFLMEKCRRKKRGENVKEMEERKGKR